MSRTRSTFAMFIEDDSPVEDEENTEVLDEFLEDLATVANHCYETNYVDLGRTIQFEGTLDMEITKACIEKCLELNATKEGWMEDAHRERLKVILHKLEELI